MITLLDLLGSNDQLETKCQNYHCTKYAKHFQAVLNESLKVKRFSISPIHDRTNSIMLKTLHFKMQKEVRTRLLA